MPSARQKLFSRSKTSDAFNFERTTTREFSELQKQIARKMALESSTFDELFVALQRAHEREVEELQTLRAKASVKAEAAFLQKLNLPNSVASLSGPSRPSSRGTSLSQRVVEEEPPTHSSEGSLEPVQGPPSGAEDSPHNASSGGNLSQFWKSEPERSDGEQGGRHFLQKACTSSSLATSALTHTFSRANKRNDSNNNIKIKKKRLANLRLASDEEISRTQAFLKGPFEYIMGGLIILSAWLMFVQLHITGVRLGVENGWEEDLGWQPSDAFFATMEHVFNAIFIVELVIKMAFQGRRFWYDSVLGTYEKFNLFDLIVVGFCTFDLWVLPAIRGSSKNGNLSFIRLVRLVRLSRGLKVIRVMKVFSKLRILVNTVASSFGALVWSMVLLGVLNFGAAVFLCQLLQSTLEEEDSTLDPETRQWLYRMYGTSPKATWTIFEFTHSGGWPNYARPVIENVHWAYSIFFAFYVSVVVFAVTRIITALFLKDTLQIAANDADMMLQESMASKQRYTQKLRDLFELADTTGDGLITLAEFEAVCRIPEVRTYFQLLELEVTEVAALYSMLDNDMGSVSYDEFIKGIFRLKGQARSMDVVTIMRDCHEINTRVQRLEDRFHSMETVTDLGASLKSREELAARQVQARAGTPPGAPPVLKPATLSPTLPESGALRWSAQAPGSLPGSPQDEV